MYLTHTDALPIGASAPGTRTSVRLGFVLGIIPSRDHKEARHSHERIACDVRRVARVEYKTSRVSREHWYRSLSVRYSNRRIGIIRVDCKAGCVSGV